MPSCHIKHANLLKENDIRRTPSSTVPVPTRNVFGATVNNEARTNNLCEFLEP